MPDLTPIALPRELVLASAGTGKTFRISSRIIGLLAAGVPPDEIFASTFTRKAAGEILDSVLGRLSAAAVDPAEAGELSKHAGLGAGPGPPRAPDDWLAILERLVRQLHRVNIGTLDSFFVRAATGFADEIALPPGWGIADQPVLQRVRSQALEEVLAAADAAVIVELVREAHGSDARRSVHEHLLGQIRELIDLHHSLDPAAADPWGALEPSLGPILPDADARREALADRIASVRGPATQSGGEHKSWRNALDTAARALRAGDWDVLLGSGLCSKLLAGEDRFDRHPIPADVAALFEEACGFAREALGRRAAARSRATGRLATLLAAAIERTQRETGAYDFADVTRLIGGPEPLCERPDLYYRLDARTQHILLDEFQDTSLAQWDALEPLVGELLSGHEGERAAVVVADPKQSIYAWRGGEPLLVHEIGRRYGLVGEQLSLSYRSSQVVLDAVNAVFADIDASPAFAGDETACALARSWKAAFAPHQAAKDLAGHVRVLVGPADEGRGTDRPNLCRRAAELVAELRRSAPGRTIGVLTRRNRTVARIIFELRRLEVPASEEGGNPLTDSAAVASVLALLRMVEHPGDTVSRYHVARTPVGEAVGLQDPEDGDAALRVAHRYRRKLVGEGYGRTLGELAAKLGGECGRRERRRLEQLVELAFRYDSRATLRISDFLRLVEAERIEDPTTAEVRVMTVHQAKGLEFDIVVLPELDLELARDDTGLLSYRPEPAGRPTRAFPYVSKAVRQLLPEAAELHEAVRQAREGRLRDGLSGLYVALTRARHALHVLVKPDGPNGPGRACTSALLVRHALAGDRPAAPGEVLYETGEPDWHARHPAAEWAEAAAKSVRDLPTVALRSDGARVRGLVRRTPSELAGGTRFDLGLALNLDSGAASEGTIAHAWLERVGWIEDGVPPEAELRSVATALEPGLAPERLDALLGRFRRWIEVPELRAVLSRSAYGGECSVEREVRFIHRDGETLIEGAIDRLVLSRENGRVMGAEVIDYKTDAVSAGDSGALESKRSFYRPQLDAYRRAVASGYRIPLGSVRCKLVVLEAGAVVEV